MMPPCLLITLLLGCSKLWETLLCKSKLLNNFVLMGLPFLSNMREILGGLLMRPPKELPPIPAEESKEQESNEF
ncbi:hypothetical protein DD598_31140 [Enterobacter cloacae complex sp. 2DZ2F16B1]|nr:hypothetical protein DD598_31140 [Enterobacter cloacae complex sp. 2DZ2F16B1]